MAADSSAIQARLSTFDTSMVVFSLVVGIGIFRTPAIVAGAAGATKLFFLAWIAGGAVALIGALNFAEIGSRYPCAGGYYRVVADSYSPMLAFMLNWSQIILQGAGGAGVAFIGADYLAPIILPPEWRTPDAAKALAGGTLTVLLVMNYLGVKFGARTQNFLSGFKIVMIVGLAVLALLLAPATHAVEVPVTSPVGPRFASALIPCFYAYGGYHMTMNLGADLKDAHRRFARAITAGVITVVTLYLLINFAYWHVLGIGGIAASKLVAAALARATFGPAGETFISLAIFVSAAGFLNAVIIHMPRSMYAMAQDGALPRAFLRVNPRTQVSEVGLLFFAACLLIPVFVVGTFEKIVNWVIFTDMVTLAVVASTIFVLRRRHIGDSGFKMIGYPVTPVFYMLCLLIVAARVLVTEPALAGMGMLILAAGCPLYLLGRRYFGPASIAAQNSSSSGAV